MKRSSLLFGLCVLICLYAAFNLAYGHQNIIPWGAILTIDVQKNH